MPANLLVAGMACTCTCTCKIMVVFNTLWNYSAISKRRDSFGVRRRVAAFYGADVSAHSISDLRYCAG
jgi:hypothetical protein